MQTRASRPCNTNILATELLSGPTHLALTNDGELLKKIACSSINDFGPRYKADPTSVCRQGCSIVFFEAIIIQSYSI